MYGGFLYRLNYEEYKKRELEIDEKIEKLSLESEDENIAPLDEAYIIRFDTEDNEEFGINDKGYFVLLVGDSDFDKAYADEVIFGLDESYSRYVELKNMSAKSMDSDLVEERFDLSERFVAYCDEDVSEIADEIVYKEKSEYGEVIKRIF